MAVIEGFWSLNLEPQKGTKTQSPSYSLTLVLGLKRYFRLDLIAQ